ncbi:MAG: T9SS type A sorting domain-containing protein [Cyclobacteriaceae bacterium]
MKTLLRSALLFLSVIAFGQNNSLDFDGSDDFVSLTRTTLASGLTFEAWIKTTSTDATSDYAGNAALTIIGDHDNNVRGSFGIHGGIVRYTQWTGTALNFDIVDGTTIVNDGKWHHVAVTHDQTTRVASIYVDGVLDVSAATTVYQTLMAYDRIGGSYLNSSGTSDLFDGEIDEVRIWNDVRSSSEISDNVYTTFSSATGLIASYDFNHASGNLIDQTGSNNGTLNGGLTYVTSGALAPTIYQATGASSSGFTANWLAVSNATTFTIEIDDNAGFSSPSSFTASSPTSSLESTSETLATGTKYYYRAQFEDGAFTSPYSETREFMVQPGNALAFDGTGQYVSILDNDALSFGNGTTDSPMTVEAWVFLDQITSRTIVSKRSSQNEWHLVISSDSRISVTLADQSSGGFLFGESAVIPFNTGEWYHIAFTYSGSSSASGIKTYLNGVLQTQVPGSSGSYTAMENTSSAVEIGTINSGGSTNFDGLIDEVRIWNEERTQSEIQNNIYQSVIGNESGLIAYYRFDEVSGLNLPDLSGNALDGTLTNMSGTEWTSSGALTQPAPVAPTNVVAYEDGGNITIDWTDNASNESAFKVYRSADFAFTSSEEITGLSLGVDANTATFTEDNTKRFYRVAAINAGGETESAAEFATTDAFAGTGMEFTALTDRVVISNPGNFAENLITAEAWIKTTSTTAFNRVISCGNAGAQRWSLSVNATGWGFSTGKVVAAAQFGGNNSFAGSTTNVNDGKWHHVAATYNLTTTALQIYVDGVLEGSGSSSGSSTITAAHVNLGNFYTTWNQSLQGQLDEVKIWNNIKSDFSDRFGPVDLSIAQPNLIAYYPFDENTGTKVVDRSGNTNNGEITGATYTLSTVGQPDSYQPTAVSVSGFTANWEAIATATTLTIEVDDNASFSSPSSFAATSPTASSEVISEPLVAGTKYYYRFRFSDGTFTSPYSEIREFMVAPGNALDFDGTEDYVNISNSASVQNLTSYTVEAWVKPDAIVNYNPIFFKTNGSGSDIEIYGRADGYSIVHNRNNGGSTVNKIGSNAGIAGQWHHLAVTYDEATTTLKIFVDGVENLSDATMPVPLTNAYSLELGRATTFGNYELAGELDEVRIWNVARSQADIQNNQYKELAGNETGLIAYYRFDESSGTNLPDLANNNDGTLTNMVGDEWTSSDAMLQVPEAPTGLVAYRSSSTEITLEWTDNTTHETGYLVERADDFGFTTNVTTVDATLSTNATSYVHSAGASAGYFYRVTPTNGLEDVSSQSSVEFATTEAFSGSALSIFTGQRVLLPNNTDFDNSTITAEAWVNTTSTDLFTRVLARGNGGNQRWSLNIGWTGEVGKVVAVIQGSPFAQATSITSVNDGKWHHIAATYDMTTLTATVYVDGVLEDTNTGTGPTYDTPNFMSLGSYNTSGNELDGLVDEVKIWSNLKTDFSDRYTPVDLSISQPNLIAYYPLDENTGTKVVDRSGNTNDGDITGANYVASSAGQPILSDPTDVTVNGLTINWEVIPSATGLTFDLDDDSDFSSPILSDVAVANPTGSSEAVTQDLSAYKNQQLYHRIRFTDGAFQSVYSETVSFYVEPNYALEFDGVNDYVDLTSHLAELDFDAPATIEFWYKSPEDYTTIAEEIFALGSTGGTSEFLIRYGQFGGGLTNPVITVAHWNSSSTLTASAFTSSNTSTYIDSWHHYAVVATGTAYQIYVDGTQVTTSYASTGSNANDGYYGDGIAPTVARIGARGNSQSGSFAKGQIDEVRIWDVARTTEQIAAFKDFELDGGEPDLVAYYDFSDGPNQSTLTDRENDVPDLNGTLTNMDATTDWIVATHGVADAGALDVINPTPTITSSESGTTNLSPFSVTITFDEVITNFDISDIAVGNGAAANLATSDNIIFTADITPGAEGTVTVNAAADVVTDLTGNGNAVATEFSIDYAIPENALSFDGSSNYVNLPISLSTAITQDFTVEAWINPNTIGRYEAILSNMEWTGGSESGYMLTLHETGELVARMYTGTDVATEIRTPITASGWQHVAMTYEGTTLSLYLDGKLSASAAASGAIDYSPTPIGINIGRYVDSNETYYYDGLIDEVRIWNVARTNLEIANNANTTLSGETGLIASYDFNHSSGDLLDLEGTYDGTVIGATYVASTALVGDEIVPVLTGLALSNITQTGLDVDITVNESSTLYYFVTDEVTVPTATQIINGEYGAGQPADNFGSFGGVTGAQNFGVGDAMNSPPELVQNTSYTIYWLAEDAATNQSAIVSEAFTTEAAPPDVTFSTIALIDDDLIQGSTDNLIYKFQMSVSGGSITTEGFFFEFIGTFAASDFAISGFTLLSNTTDDFGSSTPVASASYEPGAPVPANSTGWSFSNTYNDGDNIFFYVTADIDAAAIPGNVFSISFPDAENNFGIADPKNRIDGGLQVGRAYNILASDAIAPSLAASNPLSPADGASNISLSGVTFSITLDENIQKGTGNIEFRLTSDNSLIGSVDVSSIGIANATATITPSFNLFCGNDFYITMGAGVLEDLAGNDFAGLNPGDWNFTTPNIPTLNFGAITIQDNTNCSGGGNGAVDVTNAILQDGVPSAASNFTFEWFAGDAPTGPTIGTSASIANLSSGDYTLVVTNASTTCQSAAAGFIINDNLSDAPVISSALQDDRFCVGANGEITVTASSTSEPADYTFKLYAGIGTGTTPILDEVRVGSTGFVQQSLESGIYTIEVINNETLCFSTEQVTIQDDSILPVLNLTNVVISEETDCGAVDGSINIGAAIEESSVVQNSANYSFQWYEGSGTGGNAVGTNSATLSSFAATTYTVVFTNTTTGCVATQEIILGLDDQVAPTAIAQNISVSLDASGNASVTATEVDNGSADNCGIATTVLDVTDFTCANVGPNAVVLTVTDGNGNVNTANATVTVVDDINPVAVTQNINVTLDASGNATILPSQVDDGSSDNCGAPSLSLDITTFTCADLGANTVTLTATDGAGNTHAAIATVTIIDDIVPVAVFQNIEVSLDASGNATILPSQIDNGSSDNCGTPNLSLDITSFTCANLGTNAVVLTATDAAGNSHMANATVAIVDDIDPVAVTQNITVSLDASGNATILPSQIDNGSSDNCGAPSLSLDITSFTCADLGSNTVTLTATDGSSNSHTATATVTIVDDINPVVVTQNISVTLDAAGNATITPAQIDNGSSDNCGTPSLSLDITTFTCADLGANTVTMTATDGSGNNHTATATVTVTDNIAPVAVAQNIEVSLDASGNATITPSDVNNDSSDNCGAPSLSLDITAFTCANLGTNAVVLTATDAAGNSHTANATVTIVDDIDPVAVAQNIEVSLDASGNATILPSQVDNGSSDNCGVPSLSLDVTDFTCANLGTNAVVLTATDAAGNSHTATATVTVVDDIAPVAVTQNVSVTLDASGNASITPAQIDNGSSDNCGVPSLSLDITDFTCANLGANTVTLTATDGSGNSHTATATITVTDNIAPVAVAQNIEVSLDAAGNATIAPSDVNNGSSDNCGTPTLSLDVTAFTCTDIGANTVVLTATDAAGNSHTANATVTIVDDIDPVAVAQNITVSLDASGNVTILPSQVDNGSSDNCGTPSLSLDITSFTCADLGSNTVTLTATDGSSNSHTATATVTVVDDIDPVAVAQNITVTLDVSGDVTITPAQIDDGSSDNCGTPSLSLDITDFTCVNLGANTVTLTATDGSGNSHTATATITVTDNIAPVAVAQNIEVSLDASGNATLAPSDVNNGSSDNCGTPSLSLDITEFTCADIGANTVVLTATDEAGNSHTANATVTIVDDIDPVAVAQNISVSLDASGNVSVTAAEVDNGSSDNCGIATTTLDITDFTCTDVGANPVVLTVTDVNGNENTANATVTVVDDIDPVAVTQNINVTLDASGNATITPAQIDNGSSDNCGTPSLSLDITTFTCADLGANTVTLTATDGAGNTHTAIATVTVLDDLAPVAVAQNIEVSLDTSGNATITVAQIDNGSSDNCGTPSLSLDVTEFSCADIGANTVTLTVTDSNGNENTATATVTITDTTVPVAIAQDLTIQLDAVGNATLAASDINNGSTDNCGIQGMTLSQTAFTCSHLGANTVTLTVTDVNGNEGTADAVVTVEDSIDPTSIGQDIEISLDASGNATITPTQIDNGSSDSCESVTLSLDQTDFDCTHIGANTVTLTATDGSGNTGTTTVVVTVTESIAPIAVARDLTVELDATGNAVIIPSQVDNGSSDNCGIASMSLDKTAFTCADAGDNTVTLTVIDNIGNQSIATATVTVTATGLSEVITQDLTVALDENGIVSITPQQVDNGSSNGCSALTLSLDQSTFDCNDVGENFVTLTGTDEGGATQSATATITVVDNTDPVLSLQSKTFELDAGGNVTISASDLVTNSDDCLTFALSKADFSCSDIGDNTVTVTATDAGGNTASQEVNVTIGEGEGGADFTIITSSQSLCEGANVNMLPVVNTTGNAFRFSSGTYLQIDETDASEIDISDSKPFTIEMWFRPELNAKGVLISRKAIEEASRGYEIYFENGQVGFSLKSATTGDSVIVTTNGSELSLNTWHHLAVSYDGYKTIRTIIDGENTTQSITEHTSSGISDEGTPIYFGTRNASELPFNGAIDEIRLWNTERTLYEIQQLKNVRVDASFNHHGLMVHYDFEGVEDSYVPDRTTDLSIGADIVGNMELVSREEQAMDLDNYTYKLLTNVETSRSRAAKPNRFTIVEGGGGLNAASAGTIEMWVKWEGNQFGKEGIFGVLTARQSPSNKFTNSLLGLDHTDPNQAHLIWRPFTAYRNAIVSSTTLNEGWHHIAVTFKYDRTNGGDHRMYIDGELVGSSNVNSVMRNDPNAFLSIGSWYQYRYDARRRRYRSFSTAFMRGGLDEVRIWRNVALSQEVIQQNMEAFKNIRPLPLTVYFDFEDARPLSNYITNKSRYEVDGRTSRLSLTDRLIEVPNPEFITNGILLNENNGSAHTIEVTNKSSGCQSTMSVDIPTGESNGVSITSTTNPISCDGEALEKVLVANEGVEGDLQWYKNGYKIPGANANTYTATSVGDYSLETTSASGCSSVSGTIEVRSMVLTGEIEGSAERYGCGTTQLVINHENANYFYLQYYTRGAWRVRSRSREPNFDVTAGTYRVLMSSLGGCRITTDPVVVKPSLEYRSRISDLKGRPFSTQTNSKGESEYVGFAGSWGRSYYNHSPALVTYEWLKDGEVVSNSSKYQFNQTGLYELIIRDKNTDCVFEGTKISILEAPSAKIVSTPITGDSRGRFRLKATVDATAAQKAGMKFYWEVNGRRYRATSFYYTGYPNYKYRFVMEVGGAFFYSNSIQSRPRTLKVKAEASPFKLCGRRYIRRGTISDANASVNRAFGVVYKYYYYYRGRWRFTGRGTSGTYHVRRPGYYSFIATTRSGSRAKSRPVSVRQIRSCRYDIDPEELTDSLYVDTSDLGSELDALASWEQQDLDELETDEIEIIDEPEILENTLAAGFESEITISPQPASNYANVRIYDALLGNAKDLKLKIYDLSGVEISRQLLEDLTFGQSSTEIRLDDLPDGIYLYTIEHEGKKINDGRIVILKK